jgi:hypothetical protein
MTVVPGDFGTGVILRASIRPKPINQSKPGRSGNPKGRPKFQPLSERLHEAIEGLDADGKAIADKIVQKWIELILEGDISALRELLNRLEGRAPLHITADVHHDTETDVIELDAIIRALGYVRATPAPTLDDTA